MICEPRSRGCATAPRRPCGRLADAAYRSALETVLEESDGLIRTFNALLMIARAESGEVGATMTVFDAAEIVHDVAELYEPLAEDKGLAIRRPNQLGAPEKKMGIASPFSSASGSYSSATSRTISAASNSVIVAPACPTPRARSSAAH